MPAIPGYRNKVIYLSYKFCIQTDNDILNLIIYIFVIIAYSPKNYSIMKTITQSLSSLLLLAVLMLTGCSKSDNTPSSSSNNYKEPTLASDTLLNLPSQIETKANSDYNLINLTLAATLVNGYSSSLYGAFFYNQGTIDGWRSTKNSDGSTSYNFNYGQYGVKLTYFQSSSDSWWKYEYDSLSYSQTLYYIDDKGTSGEVDWYNFTSFKTPSVLALKDTWNKSGTTKNSTFNIYDTDGTTVTNQYVSASNADKSGTLYIYGQNDSTGPLVLQWYYMWDSTGSGSYTEYDTDGTTILNTNTF